VKKLKYDKIGYWSEVKLDIIKKYAAAYTRIMAAQQSPPFTYIYIDAFAGAGRHVSRKTGEFVSGSPFNALNIQRPFHEYHFIDLEDTKVVELEDLARERDNVFVYHGDCNKILPCKVLPRADYSKYCRALCILDPYGMHLNWEVVETAGRMKSVEIFLNFPVMGINRNVLKHNQAKVERKQINRMNALWGDESWRDVAYAEPKQQALPGLGDTTDEKTTNEALEAGFRRRLETVAEFRYVPKPMPMRNSRNAIVYYLYFASHKPVAAQIVEAIFKKYSQRRAD
jgi:three-Cys-motif partner protein